MSPSKQDRLTGTLLGTAVGDAIGLPAEGLTPVAIVHRGWDRPWRHRFVGRRGMWSDDTEHTIMLAQALLAAKGDRLQFTRCFASELRWWMTGLPAGVGLATARAILKLWLGFPPQKSGVFSAGNGPCMRTAIIGVQYRNERELRQELAAAQTQLTHSDPRATTAALAVTELAAVLSTSETAPPREAIISAITPSSSEEEWNLIVTQLDSSWIQGHSLAEFLTAIGSKPEKGISGYAYRTVPAVIYAGTLHHWDYRATLTSILSAGGDTDTTAAIAGALCGAFGGVEPIPPDWIEGIREWPTNTDHLIKLATALNDLTPLRIRPRWSPFLLIRNIFFLLIVLGHGFARLGRCLIPHSNS